jgi:AraC-like DNA-binding protein
LASFLSLETSVATSGTLMPALRLGGSALPRLAVAPHLLCNVPEGVGRTLAIELVDGHELGEIEHTTALSIADIGRLLGFQEPSAFHRAFKKWSGVQPGQYRHRVSGAAGSLARSGT